MTDESVNGFSSFLATNTKYDGTLEQNHSLTVVGNISTIPQFWVNNILNFEFLFNSINMHTGIQCK